MADLSDLHAFIKRHQRLFVITGAGCSTDSGIPCYRDTAGNWKRPAPMDFRLFMDNPKQRARYWARSMVGWRRFGSARPNAAHYGLAMLEQKGRISLLLTQNVDGLHQAAGSQRVLDLHGRLDRVRCMKCSHVQPRASIQEELEALNDTEWLNLDAMDAPDGDADLECVDFSAFAVPSCPHCGGILKPDVVFYGENVPRTRVDEAYGQLEKADAVLVVGSSLMVYSSYRYIKAAVDLHVPIAAVNLGRTRADAHLALKVRQPCGPTLEILAARDCRAGAKAA
ncbi:NAD-dependent protein deacetylase [Allopusillimonas soli]|uniref:NAD-dependent protein deacetylase n=1 Tax=Allopusillimonas soli TaxID=659016 RepID=A0A853F9T0_9BURK|nr:NAD-dependent protein deacetylase [Allopusillimonas soli]NYT35351.1 NAD-dependent protein deacetylase [Allopusillimonas soli]TEA75771.1 NAD-dependent protein deacetylase [Allopusillimonas soli]